MSIRVILIDGDAVKKRAIIDTIKDNANITIVKNLKSGKKGLEAIKSLKPKIVIIGDQLSDMSGYCFVTEVMKSLPTAILIISDEDNPGKVDYPEALDYGLVDSIEVSLKDGKITYPVLISIRINILQKLNVERFQSQIEQINKYKKRPFSRNVSSIESKQKLDNIRNALTTKKIIAASKKPLQFTPFKKTKKIIVIGASTGGPKMIVYIVSQFPPNFPPVLIVQHMPSGFVDGFAQRMNQNARMNVKMATEGDLIRSGHVYIAPGGLHMEIEKKTTGVSRIRLTDGAKVNFVKPAVDVTLFSAVREYGSGVISAILTGMGADGREGCRVVKKMGGTVFALREEDSVIYGMNKAVIDAGLADEVLGMDAIVKAIGKSIHKKKLDN